MFSRGAGPGDSFQISAYRIVSHVDAFASCLGKNKRKVMRIAHMRFAESQPDISRKLRYHVSPPGKCLRRKM